MDTSKNTAGTLDLGDSIRDVCRRLEWELWP